MAEVAKDVPDDKVPLSAFHQNLPTGASTPLPSSAASIIPPVAGSVHPGVADPTAPSTISENDELEAELEAQMLGLPGSEQDPAKKRKQDQANGNRAKKRRSKEEMVQEEVDKLSTEMAQIMASVAEWPKKPSGYDMGKLDRALANKLKMTKEAGIFEQVQRLEQWILEVRLLRECMSTASKYLPNKGLPAKKHFEVFHQAFEKANAEVPRLVSLFPVEVQQHFNEAAFLKDVEAVPIDWVQVSAHFARERLAKMYESDETLEKQTVYMIEKVMLTILDSEEHDLDGVRQVLVSTCEKIMAKDPPDMLSAKLPVLIQLCTLDSRGAATLDGIINLVHDQAESPVVRVFMASSKGREMVTLAEARNKNMQDKATALNTIMGLKDCNQHFTHTKSCHFRSLDKMTALKSSDEYSLFTETEPTLDDEAIEKVHSIYLPALVDICLGLSGAVGSEEVLQTQPAKEAMVLLESIWVPFADLVCRLAITDLNSCSKQVVEKDAIDTREPPWTLIVGKVIDLMRSCAEAQAVHGICNAAGRIGCLNARNSSDKIKVQEESRAIEGDATKVDDAVDD
eukprot:Skav215678  [mRNA]  locus=scaffold278:133855:141022:+ [translate_table: standard]